MEFEKSLKKCCEYTKKQSSKSEKIATILLTIIILVVPGIITKNQYALFKCIVLLSCGFFLLLLFLINFKRNHLDIKDKIIFIFGFLAFFSCIFSSNIHSSLLGAHNRYEGIFVIFTYILIYYSTKYYFKYYKNLDNIAIICYSLIFILVIIQFYLPVKIRNLIFAKASPVGTFGNTNFVGSFTSMIFPATFLLYLFTGKKKFLICAALRLLRYTNMYSKKFMACLNSHLYFYFNIFNNKKR